MLQSRGFKKARKVTKAGQNRASKHLNLSVHKLSGCANKSVEDKYGAKAVGKYVDWRIKRQTSVRTDGHYH